MSRPYLQPGQAQCPYILPERGEYAWLYCVLPAGHDGFCATHFDKDPPPERKWKLKSEYCCPMCRRPAEERR